MWRKCHLQISFKGSFTNPSVRKCHLSGTFPVILEMSHVFCISGTIHVIWPYTFLSIQEMPHVIDMSARQTCHMALYISYHSGLAMCHWHVTKTEHAKWPCTFHALLDMSCVIDVWGTHFLFSCFNGKKGLARCKSGSLEEKTARSRKRRLAWGKDCSLEVKTARSR